MAMVSAVVAFHGGFLSDSTDINDLATAKSSRTGYRELPTIAAAAYKHTLGSPSCIQQRSALLART